MCALPSLSHISELFSLYCPFCHAQDTKVIDSRLIDDGKRVKRRRQCLSDNCQKRFTTFEVAEIITPIVIKNNGIQEHYSVAKLRRGIERAIEKRPVSIEQINQIITTIEQNINASERREISSKKIGQWIMEQLKLIDDVAYLRFASVYLSFNDAAQFQKAISELSPQDKKN